MGILSLGYVIVNKMIRLEKMGVDAEIAKKVFNTYRNVETAQIHK